MIITVNTRGAKVKALETCLIEEDSKKSSYRIKSSELPDVLRNIYKETGIWKVKIVIDDPSELGFKIKKETQLECLERITSKHLYILEQEKDVKKFLKAIGFKDECNILYSLYVATVEIVEKCLKRDGHYKNLSQTLYTKAFNKCYPGCIDNSPEYKILQSNITSWMNKKIGQYDKKIYYKTFLKLLRKYTGHEYY